MSTTAEELNLRLFLEGQEVPVISASVSMSADFPATASVQIIATPAAFRLKTRTLVHLFFLDPVSKAKLPQTEPTSPYSLLFCGEVLAVNFSKSESSRSITLSCQDHRSYYDQANTYLFKSGSLGVETEQSSSLEGLLKSRAAFAGANSSLNFIMDNGVAGLISKLFSDESPPISPQFLNCKGVLAGIIKVIEKFTGLWDIKVGGANAFFSFAAARLNLLGQIAIYPHDESSAKLLSSDHIKKLLTSKSDQLGELVSLNDILRYIFGFIYYKMSPNPCAMFKPAELFDVDAKTPSSLGTAAKRLKAELIKIKVSLEYVAKGYNALVKKDKKEIKSKPATVVINALPDIQKFIGFAPQSLRESNECTFVTNLGSSPTTREGWESLKDEKWPKGDELHLYLAEIAKLVKARDATAPNVVVFGSNAVRTFHTLISVARSLIGARTNEDSTSLVIKGSPMPTNIVLYHFDVIINGGYVNLLNDIIAILSQAEKPIAKKFKELSTQKLNTTLIFPDLFFGVAPTSNVIFPDMYYTLSYNRNMEKEVTRFQLSTHEDTSVFGVSGVGKLTYYAPSVEELSSVQRKFLSQKSAAEEAWTGNRLLSHELTSGINPEFSFINRMALESAKLGGTKTESVQDDFYMRIANYQFLQKRLSARQLSVSGIFNPSATVGLPCVVVDSAYDASSKQASDAAEQFIGVLSTVNHNISQQGGATSYQISYARPHRSLDDDFVNKISLGLVDEPITKKLELDYSQLLSEIVNHRNNKEELLLEDALAKMRLLMSITPHAGILGTDYIVSDTWPHKLSTKDGEGFTEGSQIPVTYGAVKPNSRIPFSVDGKKEILVLGIIVTNSERAGGSEDILGNTTKGFIEKIENVSGSIDQTKYLEYLNTLVDKLAEEDTRQVRPGVDIAVKAVKRILSEASSASIVDGAKIRVSECVNPSIKTVKDEDLLLVCRAYYRGGGGRSFFNGFQKVEIIYESEKGNKINPPIEEAMRPAFIDTAYASPNIGEKVYKELLGVGSIVDVSEGDLKEHGFKKGKTAIGYKTGSSSGAYGNIVKVLSQEDAIDLICTKYAKAKNKGQFAKEYVRRDFANIHDVIGSPLSIHYKAYATSSDSVDSKRIPHMGLALEVSENSPLPEGLREASPTEIAILKQAVDVRVDVRSIRGDAVVDYVNSLTSRGLI